MKLEEERKDVIVDMAEDKVPTLDELEEIIMSKPEEIRPDFEGIKKKNKKLTYNDIDRYNPYREESKFDLGDGNNNFRWIETKVLLELIKSKISASEWRVFFYILHVTRGHCNKNRFYRTVAVIKTKEFQKWTNLSLSTIRRTICSLKKKKMIYKVEVIRDRRSKYFDETDDIKVEVIGINFRCDTWV